MRRLRLPQGDGDGDGDEADNNVYDSVDDSVYGDEADNNVYDSVDDSVYGVDDSADEVGIGGDVDFFRLVSSRSSLLFSSLSCCDSASNALHGCTALHCTALHCTAQGATRESAKASKAAAETQSSRNREGDLD